MRWNGKFLIVNILKHIYAKNIFANFPHFIAAAHRTIKRCARRSASHSVWIRVCVECDAASCLIKFCPKKQFSRTVRMNAKRWNASLERCCLRRILKFDWIEHEASLPSAFARNDTTAAFNALHTFEACGKLPPIEWMWNSNIGCQSRTMAGWQQNCKCIEID